MKAVKVQTKEQKYIINDYEEHEKNICKILKNNIIIIKSFTEKEINNYG